MQFKTSSLALLASTVAAQTCHDYVIVSTRGTFELQGPSIGFMGMINETLTKIPNGIEYDTVYPAAADQTYQLGSADVVNYITTGLQNCPKQKYALLGYSQGASVIMGALVNYTDTSSAFYKSIAAILVVGNPYHVPNVIQDVDENGGDATRKYPGSAYNADNAPGIPKVYYDSGFLIDICHTEDFVCAPAYPNATFVPGHLHYGDNDTQTLGGRFLISKIGAALQGGSASTSTSTTTTTTTTATTITTHASHHGTGVPTRSYGAHSTGTGVHHSGSGVHHTKSRAHSTGTGACPTATGTGVSPTGVHNYSSGPYTGGASSLQPAAIYGSLLVVAMGVISQLL